MKSFIIRRSLMILPTLILTTFIIFGVVRLIPGDVIDQMLKEHEYQSDVAREITVETIRHDLGLDLPIYEQYFRWIGDLILHGSLGLTLWGKQSVMNEVVQRLPVTFELGLLSLIISTLISFPVGIYSAIRQDTIGDYSTRSIAILLVAIPNFWLATMVIVFPSLWWGWSPPVLYVSFSDNPIANIGILLIPSIVLGTSMAGVVMRMTRTMMLEVLRQDYIRTAWSKGLRERVIVMRHATKNALIPVITIMGLQIPILIGGSVIIEQIFSIPGMGRLMLDAINARDYPVVSGVMLFLAIAILFINLLVDVSYGFFDPRIRYK